MNINTHWQISKPFEISRCKIRKHWYQLMKCRKYQYKQQNSLPQAQSPTKLIWLVIYEILSNLFIRGLNTFYSPCETCDQIVFWAPLDFPKFSIIQKFHIVILGQHSTILTFLILQLHNLFIKLFSVIVNFFHHIGWLCQVQNNTNKKNTSIQN